MPQLILPGDELSGLLDQACARKLLAGITFYDKNRWLTLRGRLQAVRDDVVWMEYPSGTARNPSKPLGTGDEVGVSFRMRSYRYSFTSVVRQVTRYKTDEGEAKALGLVCPKQVRQEERRIYPRQEVLGEDRARVSFWPGGRAVEPSGICPDRPVWCGNMLDLSEGGFSVRTSWDAGDLLEAGDVVGVRLQFGNTPVPLYANAQLRHVAQDGTMCVLGFQFSAMESTDGSRRTLEDIAGRVRAYEGSAVEA